MCRRLDGRWSSSGLVEINPKPGKNDLDLKTEDQIFRNHPGEPNRTKQSKLTNTNQQTSIKRPKPTNPKQLNPK